MCTYNKYGYGADGFHRDTGLDREGNGYPLKEVTQFGHRKDLQGDRKLAGTLVRLRELMIWWSNITRRNLRPLGGDWRNDVEPCLVPMHKSVEQHSFKRFSFSFRTILVRSMLNMLQHLTRSTTKLVYLLR
ncbi:hypothetical protein H2201_007788 [Coniosporium apollinis]|uniref:Uncharacterized protein n=1 Tax=Coniosporium apollinis TaxID=61459 RepID=A0ABQ9NHX9_9PEZI|nr:hypothetical protein H2201_007788 [Coniosporium apollinis]